MPHDLLVEATELWPVLKTVAKFAKTREHDEAIVTYDDGFLVIELPGTVVEIAAQGAWGAPVRVPLKELASLSKGSKMKGQVRVFVADGRFHLGGWSVFCLVKREGGAGRLSLPLDPEDSLVLYAKIVATKEEIVESGLAHAVQLAEARCAAATGSAVALLAPYGVTRAELEAIVGAAIRQKHAADERNLRSRE